MRRTTELLVIVAGTRLNAVVAMMQSSGHRRYNLFFNAHSFAYASYWPWSLVADFVTIFLHAHASMLNSDTDAT